MDFLAIASCGAYPTPTPTGAVRAALAASFGLLDITLPGYSVTELVIESFSIGSPITWVVKEIGEIG